MSIVVDRLTKTFNNQKALDDISFEAKKGEILGFLGPNGAGKSTTMKIITGYLSPSSGNVKVCGLHIKDNPLAYKSNIGYLPEQNPLYQEMYVKEYLRFAGNTFGIKGEKLNNRISEIIEICGLEKEKKKKIEALSKGFKQRVGLAQALIHDPAVLILDEPTTGLDPNQIVEIRKLIKKSSEKKTLIFSSHIMQEVQMLCDKIVVINQGKIVAYDKLDTLKEEKIQTVQLLVEFDSEINEMELTKLEGVIHVDKLSDKQFKLKAQSSTDVRPLLFDMANANGYKLLGVHIEETSMENIFQRLTKSTP